MPESQLPEKEEWKRQHDEVSKSINRILTIIIGFSFFCFLALGASDKSLIEVNAQIKLPFANTEISFLDFLVVGPAVLVALSIYLHTFTDYWLRLSYQLRSDKSDDSVTLGLPYLFNLPGRFARLLSDFLFYWLVPVVICYFVWKGSPRSSAPLQIRLSAFVVIAFLVFQLCRRQDLTLLFKSFLRLVVLSFLVLAVVPARWQRSVINRKLVLRSEDLSNQGFAGRRSYCSGPRKGGSFKFIPG
jgi:hypothetical protein